MAALIGDVSGVLNVATGVPETLLQLVEYIEEAGGKRVQTHFAPERSGDIRQSYAATEMALEKLAFRYETKLALGIKLLMSS
jgi:UDP-glucose 4-epimerase